MSLFCRTAPSFPFHLTGDAKGIVVAVFASTVSADPPFSQVWEKGALTFAFELVPRSKANVWDYANVEALELSVSLVTHRLDEMPALEAYALLTSVVQPRPIAFVSTLSAAGVPNLAPFSFFMAGGSNPPSVCFSVTLNGRGEEKDSLRNVREIGEFVVNSVDRAMSEGMNATSASLGPDESEWDVCGFAQIPSELVRPPRVANSHAQMECRLFSIVAHGDGPTAARYIIGEVVRLHLHEKPFETIARLGGSEYLDTLTGERFAIKRPG